MAELLCAGPDSSPTEQERWLAPPSDPFITPNSTAFGTEDGSDGTPAKAEGDEQAEASTADAVDDRQMGTPTSESDGEGDDDAGGFSITRRGALAAITAAIGGVSAGIITTTETPEIEAFGYGGRLVSSNGSATESATNGTTSASGVPTTGLNRTEPTNGTSSGGSEEDPSGNETRTGQSGNTAMPENVGNTTKMNGEPEAEPAPEGDEADPEESPTIGGGSDGNSDSDGGADGGGGGGTNTGGDDGATPGRDGGSTGGDTGGDDEGRGVTPVAVMKPTMAEAMVPPRAETMRARAVTPMATMEPTVAEMAVQRTIRQRRAMRTSKPSAISYW